MQAQGNAPCSSVYQTDVENFSTILALMILLDESNIPVCTVSSGIAESMECDGIEPPSVGLQPSIIPLYQHSNIVFWYTFRYGIPANMISSVFPTPSHSYANRE